MQGGTEQVDTVPASQRLVSHAFLHSIDASPGSGIWPRQADILSTVAIVGKAFIGDALVWRHAVGAGVAEATVIHIPAMQQRARSQRGVPGEWRQTAGGPIIVDQLEELLRELLSF